VLSSFHPFHYKACQEYEPRVPFGFIFNFAQHLPLELMLKRELTPGDFFVINFSNIHWELNYTHEIIKQLKDKGYRWGYWFTCGEKYETEEYILKTLTGDWTGFEKINSDKLGDWSYQVDTVMLNWPTKMCENIKNELKSLESGVDSEKTPLDVSHKEAQRA
jgi:hypothetical protein